MTLSEQVLAHARLLAGELSAQQLRGLEVLCRAVTVSLEARLRDGLTSEDCKADFIASASLLALAALSDANSAVHDGQVTVGDFTVRRDSSDAAANCLRAQAELMIAPYLKSSFSFQGV